LDKLPPILILAGGKATRLKGLAKSTPKYLMPVGHDKTFADLHLGWLSSVGFREIFISIGHLGDQIRKYCGTGENWNLEIKYLEDGPTLIGTGGAVRKSLHFEYDDLCVTYGDTLLNFSVIKFIEAYKSAQALSAMTVFLNETAGHVCNIGFDEKWITYNKINPDPQWTYIDYGFMILKRSFIEAFSTEQPLDLSVPLSRASYKRGVLGFEVYERFWEIGSLEALDAFQQRIKN
jgi:NDP-sugar pyrophosphorylase family protein